MPAAAVASSLAARPDGDCPAFERFARDPEGSLEWLAGALAEFWDLALAEWWSRVTAAIEEDILLRGRTLLVDGADALLNEKLMGASFLAQNGGKKSITVNLKSEGGRNVLRRLARDAAADAAGHAGPRRPAPGHRRAGYGQEGPMKDAPAYDQIIQGLSGVMSITGDEKCAPLRVGYPIADTIGGITAAFSVASALVRRSATGTRPRCQA